jgi:hypothetical protein
LLERAHDRVDVVAVPLGERLADGAHFLSDSIPGHGYSSINSSGVQITGGTKPAARHTPSIISHVAAFARCVQFLVRKKSIPFTAAVAGTASLSRAKRRLQALVRQSCVPRP